MREMLHWGLCTVIQLKNMGGIVNACCIMDGRNCPRNQCKKKSVKAKRVQFFNKTKELNLKKKADELQFD